MAIMSTMLEDEPRHWPLADKRQLDRLARSDDAGLNGFEVLCRRKARAHPRYSVVMISSP